MSDFLVSLDPASSGAALLDLLRQPYGDAAPEGHVFERPWGALAMLEDQIAGGRNLVRCGDDVFGWVGDVVTPDLSRLALASLESLQALPRVKDSAVIRLRQLRESGLLKALNGAFATVWIGNDSVVVATDPMASVPVYVGRDARGRVAALGTHADLVARLVADRYEIDPVSVADFINNGIPCCPYTMHRNVRELAPGSILTVELGDGPPADAECEYWTPPEAVSPEADERELSEQFRQDWVRAVADRCAGEKLGVQLSGGLDSRLVMAAIPSASQCVGLTLCDTLNREARVAREVAAAYRRPWITLDREPEYLGQTALPATRFVGCEGEWHHGHSIGFRKKLADLGIDTVFTGLLMDNHFKGYYARDMERVPRLGGLLPATYRPRPVDYPREISAFCDQRLVPACVEGMVSRRAAFAETHPGRTRASRCEWFDARPLSQSCDNTGWSIERRVLPLRIPVMDRRLVDLAFRIPIQWKVRGFFERAATPLLGPGGRVINANNGVLPGSGHARMLAQRAVRKLQNTQRGLKRRLGLAVPVPHSWHDFPKYLRESPVLSDLRRAHGARLEEFSQLVFRTPPGALLHDAGVPWNVGYRLLQLALWRAVIDDYRVPRLRGVRRGEALPA